MIVSFMYVQRARTTDKLLLDETAPVTGTEMEVLYEIRF